MINRDDLTADQKIRAMNFDRFEQGSFSINISNSSNLNAKLYFNLGNRDTQMEKWEDSEVNITGDDLHVFNITVPSRYISLTIEIFSGSCNIESYATLKA